MKQLSDSTYSALTPRQRLSAAIAADARGDTTELQRLKSTCPRRTFSMTDPAFSEQANGLFKQSLAIECELRGLAIMVLAADKAQDQAEVDAFVSQMANIDAAWMAHLEAEDINPADMEKVQAPRHHAVTLFLTMADDGCDERQVAEITRQLSQYLDACCT